MKTIKTCQECKKDIDKMKLKGEFLVKGKVICNECYLTDVISDDK